jgi:ribonuclease BN (tRNA processing enzyme)
MKIKILGSGNAFCLAEENYHSNFIIESEGENLLFDAGTTIAEALNGGGVAPADIDNIFISHLHGDHCGGIEYIAFKTYFEQFPFGENKINLIGHKTVMETGWDRTWSGGLRSIEGQRNTLETYFDTNYLEDNGMFFFGNARCLLFPTQHVVDDKKLVASYGIVIKENCKTLMITGDTQYDPEGLELYYADADIIMHECEFSDYDNSVHSQYRKLILLPDHIKAKIWLYHYSDNGDLPDVKRDGFLGLLKRGDTFEC